MRNLFLFIIRHHFLILFLIIESISISLLQYNNYHKTEFSEYSSAISGYINSKLKNIKEYANLKEKNQQLIKENVRLRNKLTVYELKKELCQKKLPKDKLHQYEYISSNVINNSTNKQYNYITLNKGSEDSIQHEMGAISKNGVVGIVRGVSENFSIVLPILNRNLNLSAAIKKNNYYGSISWNGKDYRYAMLNEIPYHVSIAKGDTIVTSGYSAIFPKGITIGYISDYEKGGNFYNIRIRLATNFKNLSYVYIINNELVTEQKQLENKIKK